MAKATSTRSKVQNVTLILSRTEAMALTHLLRIVGGPFTSGTVRAELSEILKALRGEFDGDFDFSLSDSHKVIGGQCTVRTDGRAYMENKDLYR